MKKKYLIIIVALLIVFAVAMFLRPGAGSASQVTSSYANRLVLPVIITASLVDSINPCAFSVLLLTIAFLLSAGKMREKIIEIGGFYIFGIFLAYILIGLGILRTLDLLNIPHSMAKIGALIMIVFGIINLINEFFPAFPIKLKIPKLAHHRMAVLIEKGSLPAALLLGILVGLYEFPCTGGPYLMVLGLLHDHINYYKGLLYLFFYNLIFVAPLIVILIAASSKFMLARVEKWQKSEKWYVKLFMSLLMIGIGVLIFFL